MRIINLSAISAVILIGLTACCSSQQKNRNQTQSYTTGQITKKQLTYRSQGNTIQGTICYPLDKEKSPAVILLHTASGFHSHEERFAEMLAGEGFIALALNYSPPTNGSILGDDEHRYYLERIIVDGGKSLQEDPAVDGNHLGVIGYSLGGYFATYMATQPDQLPIRAAIVYYGIFSRANDMIEDIKAPILILQGEKDRYPSFIDDAKAFHTLLRAQNKDCELVLYEKAAHMFDFSLSSGMNNTNAARDAWIRGVRFLKTHLK